MTIRDALKNAAIDRLDAELLIAHILGQTREWVLAHDELEVDEGQWKDLEARRCECEPIAYITNTKEFYGRDYFVDSRVLIPRPETERMIDFALDVLKNPRNTDVIVDPHVVGLSCMFTELTGDEILVDIGTGSGCMAITLALETDRSVIATDISADALEVAILNANTHGVANQIDFRHGEYLDPIADLETPFVIISNPPYVPVREKQDLMKDVHDYEPHLALFAGPDGSDLVVNIYNRAKSMPLCKGCVFECRSAHVEHLK